MVKLLLASALAAATASAANITAECKNDNTVSVTIHSDIAADILDITYGDCDESNNGTGIDNSFLGKGQTQWTGTLDPARCNMEDKLRTLQYNQTASFTVGKKDGSDKLVFATFDVDTYCEYTSTYTVTFNYGNINATNYDFDTSGGLIGLNFYFTSTASDFVTQQDPSNTAGEKVYLVLKLNDTANPNFDHANAPDSLTGKLFVPTKCQVMDTANSNANYTLFDTATTSCENDFIDLSVAYYKEPSGKPEWRISHDLFLLNNNSRSTYTLMCDVLVCDGSDKQQCLTAGTTCDTLYNSP